MKLLVQCYRKCLMLHFGTLLTGKRLQMLLFQNDDATVLLPYIKGIPRIFTPEAIGNKKCILRYNPIMERVLRVRNLIFTESILNNY